MPIIDHHEKKAEEVPIIAHHKGKAGEIANFVHFYDKKMHTFHMDQSIKQSEFR